MSATDVDTTELTDPELISRVREGDVDAYGSLFARHVDAATRLARGLVNGSDADDLVSEAFVKVLNVLLGGGGPDVAFRAYLLTAVRRLHVDRVRGGRRLTTTDDLTPFDPGVPFTDPAVAGFEGGAAARAFASLPERWQMVLWHLEVENQKPADIAPLLGMSANSVSALAYRAREGLRQAFLNMHSGDLVGESCRETHDLLGGYVRGGLSRRDAGKVEDHLDHCRRCTAVYLELAEVNSSLAAVLAPALLGTAALGYLGAATGGATGAAAGLTGLVGRGKDLVVANAPASAAAAAIVGVAGVLAVVAATGGASPGPTGAAGQPSPQALIGAFGAPSTTSAPATAVVPGGVSSPGAATATTLPATVAPTTAPTTAPTASPSASSSASPSATPAANPSTGTRPGATTPSKGGGGGGTGNGSPGPARPPTGGTDPGPGTGPGTDPGTGPGTDPGTGPGTDPGPGPDPDPEPDQVAAVGLDLSTRTDRSQRPRVTVRVTGVPDGVPVTLLVTAGTGGFHEHGAGGCTRSGRDYTCTATRARSTFFFHTDRAGGSATLDLRVVVPDGYTDPDPGDNTASVTLSPGGTPG